MLTEQQVESLQIILAALERIARLKGAINKQVDTCGVEGMPLFPEGAIGLYWADITRRLEAHRMEMSRRRYQRGSARKAA